MSQPDINQLLKEGIDAVNAGDRGKARHKLEQVLQLDKRNERAWLWLAAVVDSEDEKRMCLSNVLYLNPENERAQRMLEKLNEGLFEEAEQAAALPERQRRSETEPEIEMSDEDDFDIREDESEATGFDLGKLPELPFLDSLPQVAGLTRAQLNAAVIGGGGFLLFILLVIIISSLGGGGGGEDTTVGFSDLDATSTQIALIGTQAALPTATATLNPREVPLFTPTTTTTALPSPTMTNTPVPTPPSTVLGNLATWGGRDSRGNRFLPLAIFRTDTGEARPIGATSLDASHVDFHPSGQRLIFTTFFSSTSSIGIQALNVGSSNPEPIGFDLPVVDQQQPNYCASGNSIVFIGTPQGEELAQVYVFDFNTEVLLRMTNDGAAYSEPSFSPQCDRIAVIRNDVSGGDFGEDIVLINTTTMEQSEVTRNRTEFIESSPDWSPDGSMILYAAAPATQPENNDIALINADGSGVPRLPVRDAADDIFPIFSPDGRYLAFASNRAGSGYEVFIFDQNDGMLWQLTHTSVNEDVYPGSWWQF